jgi:glycerol kinase
MNTGEKPVASAGGLLTTVGWQIGNKTTYVLEGSVFICGAAIQWLRDGLGLLATAAESEALAASVENSGGVYFVPAFVGLGTPYWNSAARGTIVGLTRGTTKAHLVRATLEAMAFQTVDVVDAMCRDAGLSVPILRVDGGATANNLLLSLQSDLLGLPILRPACIETTALGAANLAGIATGVFEDLEEIQKLSKTDRIFTPALPEAERAQRIAAWRRAIDCAVLFSQI